MTILLVLETAILLVLAVLVAGLLRGYAAVLRRLHELDGGALPAPVGAGPPFRTAAGVVGPAQSIEGRDEWAESHDIDGVSLRGETVSIRTVGVPQDTVIAFLSATCEGCTGFWQELADRAWAVPPGSRLVVVTRDPAQESPSVLEQLCPPDIDLIMSSQAWADFAVPGSPYLVVADGRTGRVKGEGSGASFTQVGGLLQQSVSDAGHPAVVKSDSDRRRARDVDRLLLAAGIGPNDSSLHRPDPAEERR